MQISQRAKNIQPSATLALSTRANAMRAEGIDVINLTVGEPDFQTPKNIRAAAIAAINDGKADSYTPVLGIKELREKVAEVTNKDYNTNFTSDNVAVTTGGKFALYAIAQCLLNQGDEVIIPLPYWVSYGEQIKLSDGKPVFVKPSKGLKVTASDLESARTDKTVAMILNSPQNPSGLVYTKEELEEIGNWAVKNDIVIICDDMYGKLVYNSTRFVSLMDLSDDIRKQTILVSGLSKSYAMTGWRVGYAVADAEFIKKIAAVAGHSTSNLTAVSQYAALEALNGDQSSVSTMREAYEERLNKIYEELKEIPGFVFDSKPQGAFYLFPNVAEAAKLVGCSNVSEFAEFLLEKAHVAVVPGVAFGMSDYIRISYAASLDDLEEAVKRIKMFVEERK